MLSTVVVEPARIRGGAGMTAKLPVPAGLAKSGAERTRLWRARKLQFRRVYRIEADEAEVEDVVSASGKLEPEKLDDTRAVEKAISELFAEWLRERLATL